MGVKGLHVYIENHCPKSCTPRVNITDLCRQYRHRSGGRRPILVFDGLSILRKLYNPRMSWVHGGQWREYYEILRDLVERLTRCGFRLVFIFDGVVAKSKRHVWVDRTKERCRIVRKMFKSIEEHGTEPRSSMFVLPPALGAFTRLALKSLGVTVINSIVEADLEIAEYCKRNECFGIVGIDTDLLIFNVANVFDVHSFDLKKKLSAAVFDVSRICKHLGISPVNLPLLACLLGNDIIPQASLHSFHRRILKLADQDKVPGYETLIPRVCKYISSLGIKQLTREAVAWVQRDVFPNNPTYSLFEKVVRMYQLDGDVASLVAPINSPADVPEQVRAGKCNGEKTGVKPAVQKGETRVHKPPLSAEICELARQRHVNIDNNAIIYRILIDGELDSGVSAQDFASEDLPQASVILKPTRQKMYGLLYNIEVQLKEETEEEEKEQEERRRRENEQKIHQENEQKPASVTTDRDNDGADNKELEGELVHKMTTLQVSSDDYSDMPPLYVGDGNYPEQNMESTDIGSDSYLRQSSSDSCSQQEPVGKQPSFQEQQCEWLWQQQQQQRQTPQMQQFSDRQQEQEQQRSPQSWNQTSNNSNQDHGQQVSPVQQRQHYLREQQRQLLEQPQGNQQCSHHQQQQQHQQYNQQYQQSQHQRQQQQRHYHHHHQHHHRKQHQHQQQYQQKQHQQYQQQQNQNHQHSQQAAQHLQQTGQQLLPKSRQRNRKRQKNLATQQQVAQQKQTLQDVQQPQKEEVSAEPEEQTKIFPGKNAVREWCNYSDFKSRREPEVVEALPLNLSGGTPTLEELWLSKDPEMDESRLQAFLACWNCQISMETLRGLPSHFQIFSVVLHYLIQWESREILEEWEVEAFIAQAVSPLCRDIRYLKSLKEDPVKARAVHLATIFLMGVAAALDINSTCGYPFRMEDGFPWKFFDGKLFHWKYLWAKEGYSQSDKGIELLCDHNDEAKRLFTQLKKAIVEGSRMEKTKPLLPAQDSEESASQENECPTSEDENAAQEEESAPSQDEQKETVRI